MGIVIKGPPPPIAPEVWARMTPEQRQHHVDMQKAMAMRPSPDTQDTSNPLGWLIGAAIIGGLMGCSPAPAECTDHRLMTFYEQDGFGWSGIKASNVCVVSEHRMPLGAPPTPTGG